MCGFINVFLKAEDNSLITAIKERGNALIKHRGPDYQGFFHDSRVFMSFHRLSIMDPTPAGHQPLTSSCGRYVMTFNGEIYNFRDLMHSYNLRNLKSHCDSEVLLELYAQLGGRVIDVIRGMYGFVIYDKKKHTFFGARDPFGIKPLYYTHTKEGLIFSSEIKPLLSLLKTCDVNEEAVIRFLQSGNMDDLPKTFYKKIHQLSPGYVIEGQAEYFQLKKGCSLQIDPIDENNQDEYSRDYHQLLLEKIDQYLYSDVPVGISLSGGFDSSLLAYLINAKARGQRLHMFCRGYENYEGNELEAARQIGEKFGFRYHEAILSPKEVPHLLLSCSKIQEHPVTSISILAFHKLYKIAKREGLKVLLEGHGGDEVWAGYAYYQNALTEEKKDNRFFSQDGSHFLINRDILRFTDVTQTINLNETIVKDPPHLSWLTQMQLKDMFGGKMQRSLRYIDRASMNESIEVRLPFLDLDIAEAALRIPDRWKIHDGNHRYFMRRLATEPLGKEVAFRTKVPIQDPQRLWLQTHLTDYVRDTLHSENLFIHEYVDVKKLSHHFENFIQSPKKYPNLTFIIFPLCLEAWYQSMKEYLNEKTVKSNLP